MKGEGVQPTGTLKRWGGVRVKARGRVRVMVMVRG